METEVKKPKKKTTMSVTELGKKLGLKKTEAYYLVRKEFFETITVYGQMRVVIDSFEEWYANQWHYKKVDGEHPGWKLAVYITPEEIEADLGINDAGWLIYNSGKFQLHRIRGQVCIKRCDYEEWYRSQFRYTRVNGEPPGKIYPPSYSSQEVAAMLGIPLRNTLYFLVKKEVFKSFHADGQLRIDIESFEEWYRNQDHYRKVAENNGINSQEEE